MWTDAGFAFFDLVILAVLLGVLALLIAIPILIYRAANRRENSGCLVALAALLVVLAGIVLMSWFVMQP